jgi:hypothetical protein
MRFRRWVMAGAALAVALVGSGCSHSAAPAASPPQLGASIVASAGAGAISLQGFNLKAPVICAVKAGTPLQISGMAAKPLDYRISITVARYHGDGSYAVVSPLGATQVMVSLTGTALAEQVESTGNTSSLVAVLATGRVTVQGSAVSFTGTAGTAFNGVPTGTMEGTVSC